MKFRDDLKKGPPYSEQQVRGWFDEVASTVFDALKFKYEKDNVGTWTQGYYENDPNHISGWQTSYGVTVGDKRINVIVRIIAKTPHVEFAEVFWGDMTPTQQVIDGVRDAIDNSAQMI